MAFNPRCLVQNAMGVPAQIQKPFRHDDAGNEGGGTGTESLAQRNVVNDLQIDRRKRAINPGRRRKSGLPDQIVIFGGNQMRISPTGPDGKLVRDRKPALQKNVQCNGEGVESRADVRAGPRDTKPDNCGQGSIIQLWPAVSKSRSDSCAPTSPLYGSPAGCGRCSL